MPGARNAQGEKGVFRGGKWVDIGSKEEIEGSLKGSRTQQKRYEHRGDVADVEDLLLLRGICCGGDKKPELPEDDAKLQEYDVAIIGAGCVGGAVARELAKLDCKVVLLEGADDVTQGATKGNSGIVHAGFDDKPGSVRAKFCWPGNQMFPQLDNELNFGYVKNGSLVVATNAKEREMLDELMERGKANGVQNLRIVERDELMQLEPNLNPEAVAALRADDAGTLIPYEFTIALVENAVDNGVELRVRRRVIEVVPDGHGFVLTAEHWEPDAFLQNVPKKKQVKAVRMGGSFGEFALYGLPFAIVMAAAFSRPDLVHAFMTLVGAPPSDSSFWLGLCALSFVSLMIGTALSKAFWAERPPEGIAAMAAKRNIAAVPVKGRRFEFEPSPGTVLKGRVIKEERIHAKFVVNCAGCASDEIAALIGDKNLFKVKPRLGEYILLHKDEGQHIHSHTIFPCPDPAKGKGVLAQNTLWGNLILGPTARDTLRPVVGKPGEYEIDPAVRDEDKESITAYILAHCKKLLPTFDAGKVIHTFAGARAKTSRGDWIIEPSAKNPQFIHAAGIDSPGIAASPAIAVEVVRLLEKAGLKAKKNASFNPFRPRIIRPKTGSRGLKFNKNSDDIYSLISGPNNDLDPETNVICKCEKVTEAEIVDAIHRSVVCDSTQAVRKRTRAGMGHCQADPDNYNCEKRVAAIIARETGMSIEQVTTRPWPASSLLPKRWLEDDYREQIRKQAAAAKLD